MTRSGMSRPEKSTLVRLVSSRRANFGRSFRPDQSWPRSTAFWSHLRQILLSLGWTNHGCWPFHGGIVQVLVAAGDAKTRREARPLATFPARLPSMVSFPPGQHFAVCKGGKGCNAQRFSGRLLTPSPFAYCSVLRSKVPPRLLFLSGPGIQQITILTPSVVVRSLPDPIVVTCSYVVVPNNRSGRVYRTWTYAAYIDRTS